MGYIIDIEKILFLFRYDEGDPLLFTTSFFLFIFFALLLFYRVLSDKKTYRLVLLLVFSFFFYYKVSGLFFLLLIFSSFANYSAGILTSQTRGLYRKFFFVSGIAINILLLGYFKYTNFFVQVITDFKLHQITPIEIILPIGISFYTLKAISYLIDVYRETIPAERNFLNFTLYISFFSNVLAGPIDRAGSFLPQIKKDFFLTKLELGSALYFLMSGVFKKAVIADYISLNFVDRVFDDPLRFTGIENLIAVYGYALQIYCDFSGYTDIATGTALLLGYKLMENFRSPYRSASIAEFWRRWHISLSTWLLDYLFRPLQIRFRYMRLWGNISALLVTFILCGLWHGASWTFIFWGFLHGFFMSFSLLADRPRKFIYSRLNITNSKWLRYFKILITFHLTVFAWIFFRAEDFSSAADILSQIFSFFNAHILTDFLAGYTGISILLLTGYILHFIPERIEINFREKLADLPLVGKALLLAVVIWTAAQFRAADLQPFIYFNF